MQQVSDVVSLLNRSNGVFLAVAVALAGRGGGVERLRSALGSALDLHVLQAHQLLVHGLARAFEGEVAEDHVQVAETLAATAVAVAALRSEAFLLGRARH